MEGMEGTNTETQPHSCFTAVPNSGYYTDPCCDETRAKAAGPVLLSVYRLHLFKLVILYQTTGREKAALFSSILQQTVGKKKAAAIEGTEGTRQENTAPQLCGATAVLTAG